MSNIANLPEIKKKLDDIRAVLGNIQRKQTEIETKNADLTARVVALENEQEAPPAEDSKLFKYVQETMNTD